MGSSPTAPTNTNTSTDGVATKPSILRQERLRHVVHGWIVPDEVYVHGQHVDIRIADPKEYPLDVSVHHSFKGQGSDARCRLNSGDLEVCVLKADIRVHP